MEPMMKALIESQEGSWAQKWNEPGIEVMGYRVTHVMIKGVVVPVQGSFDDSKVE